MNRFIPGSASSKAALRLTLAANALAGTLALALGLLLLLRLART
ncbi:MAG TPA: hypothetical protein VGR63_01215 [Casimicrobiaceae bacterium]|nr:hypothetical protein [Casimicrobiaceae bacterium]